MLMLLVYILAWQIFFPCPANSQPAPHSDIILLNEQKINSLNPDKLPAWFVSLDSSIAPKPITITEPLSNTVFPPDMASPVFLWTDQTESRAWHISIENGSKEVLQMLVGNPWWMPDQKTWENIIELAGPDQLKMHISGLGDNDLDRIVSRGSIIFQFSEYPVDAKVMFMRKPLPFLEAQKKPEKTELLVGRLDSYEPPQNILYPPPVCANCHAYSADGRYITIDTDYGGDKGGFIFSAMDDEIIAQEGTVFSWNELEPVQPASYSMGLFAQLSPDGRHIAGTVSETSVFIMMDDIYFSQLFYPATGKIGIFNTKKQNFSLLPGADLPNMVQTGPTWSPDGQSIAFSATSTDPDLISKVMDRTIRDESSDQTIFELNERYPVQFDIYTVDFNQGKGGTPKPLPGASNNGYSNYFPRYSPDGKWIVFTRSPTGLVLQPDSELWIVPAKGGNARPLAGNQPVMNSWHAWSPNSKWLVFTSKARSAFTELYLTHINDQGESSPAIRLSRFSSNDLAAMVPEFIPRQSTIPQSIIYGPDAVGESMAIDGR